MDTTPRKGLSKGCLIGLIAGLVIIVLLIAFFVMVYVFRDSLVKAGATASVSEVKKVLATAPPAEIDTVQFNSLADAYIDKVNLDTAVEFQPLAVFVQQMTDALKDRKLDREEVMTAAAAMISRYPDLEQYWVTKQEETAPTQDTLGGE